MNPIVRITILFATALGLLAAVGVGANELFNIWVALMAVLATAILLACIANEGLAIGAFFALRSLKDKSDFEESRFGDLDDEDVGEAISKAAQVVTDDDLQEALHHFTHLAAFCPGSKAHAERLQVVLEHLQMRLSASTVQPMSAEERHIVH